MEENICLFALDGHIRCAVVGNGVWRSRNVLLLLVLGVGLGCIGLDVLSRR